MSNHVHSPLANAIMLGTLAAETSAHKCVEPSDSYGVRRRSRHQHTNYDKKAHHLRQGRQTINGNGFSSSRKRVVTTSILQRKAGWWTGSTGTMPRDLPYPDPTMPKPPRQAWSARC